MHEPPGTRECWLTGVVVLVVGDDEADVVEDEVLVVDHAAHGEATDVVRVVGAQVRHHLGRHRQVVHDPTYTRAEAGEGERGERGFCLSLRGKVCMG